MSKSIQDQAEERKSIAEKHFKIYNKDKGYDWIDKAMVEYASIAGAASNSPGGAGVHPEFLSVLQENYEAAKRIDTFSLKRVHNRQILLKTYEDLIFIYKHRCETPLSVTPDVKDDGKEAIEFAEWHVKDYVFVDGDFYHKDDTDGDGRLTAADLYKIFKNLNIVK